MIIRYIQTKLLYISVYLHPCEPIQLITSEGDVGDVSFDRRRKCCDGDRESLRYTLCHVVRERSPESPNDIEGTSPRTRT
jgi:hypothetical protein